MDLLKDHVLTLVLYKRLNSLVDQIGRVTSGIEPRDGYRFTLCLKVNAFSIHES